MKRTLILDCNFLCYKAWYSQGQLSFGHHRTGIIYGFFRQLQTLCRDLEPTGLVFCWDSRKSVRKKSYPAYKEGRHENETAHDRRERQIAYEQFNLLQELLHQIGFRNIFQWEGFESDDIIARIVTTLGYPNLRRKRWVVVSSDEDLYQLLDYCTMYKPSKGFYSRDDLHKEFDIFPQVWVTVKCTAGCKTDNVAGVRGVGNATAIKFIQGKLLPTSKAYSNIRRDFGITRENLKLVKLPHEESPKKIALLYDEPDPSKFLAVCREHGMNTLIRDMRWWKSLFNTLRENHP